jgi:hypothetical protein
MEEKTKKYIEGLITGSGLTASIIAIILLL